MIHSTIAVQDGNTLLFGPFTITPVHAVIRPVVPLAGKDEETLWEEKHRQKPIMAKILHRTLLLRVFKCDASRLGE